MATLRELRKATDWTQEDVGKRISLSQKTVSRHELTGKITTAQLDAYAALYGIGRDDISVVIDDSEEEARADPPTAAGGDTRQRAVIAKTPLEADLLRMLANFSEADKNRSEAEKDRAAADKERAVADRVRAEVDKERQKGQAGMVALAQTLAAPHPADDAGGDGDGTAAAKDGNGAIPEQKDA